jgi:hypothetical protein
MRPVLKIPILQQLRKLRTSSIDGDGRCTKDTLIWVFKARPSPLGREYKLRVEYKLTGVPNVTVISHDLSELANNRRLPHTYPEKKLCLFMPKYGEWNYRSYIAETIIPWAILWLFYFEHWLITGDWQGGGEHPQEHYKWGVK